MKKNILFIYRGQVLLKEFLPEYEKYLGENCVLLVEKGIPFNIVFMDIKKIGLNVASDWEDMVALMKKYNDLDPKTDAKSLYTNEFLN
jgi:hypothetical protein